MHQAYDIRRTYEENYQAGPQLDGLTVECPVSAPKQFLSYSVRSRIGIAAGLLLNSKWIKAYARLGFDVLTYKTVRSSHRPCYPVPNWVFVSDDDQLHGPVFVCEKPPADPSRISSAVCFGMPSMAPDVWRRDVELARESLEAGQILIVSVVATPQPGWGAQEISDDFARCALWAKESGAHVVEANLSCPNVCSAEGSIYRDSNFSRGVAEAVRAQIGDLPLLLKIGYFDQLDELGDFLRAVAPAADGVTLVNGVTRSVLNQDGTPAFGAQYERAGVLGRVIHPASIASVSAARDRVQKGQLNLSILGVGGASTVGDVDEFFRSGADGVMFGSSPMYLPTLARDVKIHCEQW